MDAFPLRSSCPRPPAPGPRRSSGRAVRGLSVEGTPHPSDCIPSRSGVLSSDAGSASLPSGSSPAPYAWLRKAKFTSVGTRPDSTAFPPFAPHSPSAPGPFSLSRSDKDFCHPAGSPSLRLCFFRGAAPPPTSWAWPQERLSSPPLLWGALSHAPGPRANGHVLPPWQIRHRLMRARI